MSRRSIIKENILNDFENYPVGALHRDLKKLSKDKWKIKEVKRERRKKGRKRGNR